MAKKCKICSKEFTPRFKTTERHCSRECFNKEEKPNLKLKSPKKINQVSDKRKVLNEVYKIVRIEVLSEAKFKCFIDGCINVANTLEHLMGRRGFADDFARENNIPLLIDKRYLKACCLVHNGELETNPELSKKYQYHKISGKKKSDD
jgi:hypothetical protein